MKLKKLYIKNFKGIETKQIIELNNNTTLLVGPNGFGKTTLFDAIELCLTGSLHRTKMKSGVTSDRSDYKKPFFQNNKNKEVTLKLWLENKKGEQFIIVRHLDSERKNRPKQNGRKNKPTDFGLLNLFNESQECFEEDIFNTELAIPMKESDISEFFEFIDKEIKIKDIYHIFNYLQQEETTFFLKKSESDRKGSLGFLLQTDKQEAKLEKIKIQLKKLTELKEIFVNKANDIIKEQTEKFVYEKVFQSSDVALDNESPFDGINNEDLKSNLKEYLDNIEKLTYFLNNFSPSEFKKRQLSENIEKLILRDSGFIENFILKEFINDSKYNIIQQQQSEFNNIDALDSFILQKFIPQAIKLRLIYNTFSEIDHYEKAQESEKMNLMHSLVKKLMPDSLFDYDTVLKAKSDIEINLSALNKSVFELTKSIEDVKSYYKSLIEHEKNCLCPFCGTPFDDFEKLITGLESRKLTLAKLSDSNNDGLNDIEKRLNDKFRRPLEQYISIFKEENKRCDHDILVRVEELFTNEIETMSINNATLNHKSEFIWRELSGKSELELLRKSLNDFLVKSLSVSTDIWQKIKVLKSRNYKSADDLIEKLGILPSLKKYTLNFITDNPISRDQLNDKVNGIRRIIDITQNKYQYDPAKCIDSDNLYQQYFKSDNELFNTCTVEQLQNKKNYLSNLVVMREQDALATYENKIKRLSDIINPLINLKNKYSEEIKTYKREMVKKIQVPFFIYTAKILQNYQQGMGIYIHVKDDSAIRFLANNESDHDVMHHLSSGQLAVVSLAFCLAVNKTYEISPNMKFLAIDDPVQEMDALNIHSFVDLVRNELVHDYQLIFSTHNDDNALFMKYKIEKIYDDSVGMIDVQQRFFPPLSHSSNLA